MPPRSTPTTPWLRSRWALTVVGLAVVAVAVALVVAVRGLFGDPVGSTDGAGITTLRGTFFPYECSAVACRGYVQDGGRSVFVVFPSSCPEPARQSDISVRARRAPELGKASYAAVACAAPR